MINYIWSFLILIGLVIGSINGTSFHVQTYSCFLKGSHRIMYSDVRSRRPVVRYHECGRLSWYHHQTPVSAVAVSFFSIPKFDKYKGQRIYQHQHHRKHTGTRVGLHSFRAESDGRASERKPFPGYRFQRNVFLPDSEYFIPAADTDQHHRIQKPVWLGTSGKYHTSRNHRNLLFDSDSHYLH